MDPSQKLIATIEAQKLFVSEIGLITHNKAPLNVLGMKKLSFETKKDMALGLQWELKNLSFNVSICIENYN
ncbi:unnamed protein product [Prunus armeniaca]|uniref:Uncharacterized protein n=1 Tax=Prunus armeniaca TaxID=36596 RepID=A0A6J5VK74_PRUAR|nr:unnamed protein product [Prunus armeniaca]